MTITWAFGKFPSVIAFKMAATVFDLQSWPGESGQWDKWIFCLRAAKIAADQERA